MFLFDLKHVKIKILKYLIILLSFFLFQGGSGIHQYDLHGGFGIHISVPVAKKI